MMRIDGYMELYFKKLKDFSIKDYYINCCRVSITFLKTMNINGFIPIEFDRCELIEDEHNVYVKLSGFTPSNIDEEFLDRLFKSLIAMLKNLDPVLTNPQVIMEDLHDNHVNWTEYMKYTGFKPVRY